MRALLWMVMALVLMGSNGSRAEDDALPMLPEITGKNLEGEPFTFPKDFEADLTLAFFAFKQRHQEDVDTWFPLAGELQETHGSRFAFIEFPTLPGWWPGILQRRLDNAMYNGIPDPAQRARTITLYTDKSALRKALGIPDEKVIHVFLIEKSGQIRWRSEGPITQEAETAVRDLVDTLLAP